MNQRALIKHLEKHGCIFFRQGKKHIIYWNPSNRKTSAIPRHREIPNKLALKICKDLGIPPTAHA